MAAGPDGARPDTEQLREQVEQQRHALADTFTALHEKTDVKGRAREKAAGAEMAVANLAHWAGRTASAGPRFVRWTASTASEQAHKLPKPVRAPVDLAAGLLSRRVRILLAFATVLGLAARRWQRRR